MDDIENLVEVGGTGRSARMAAVKANNPHLLFLDFVDLAVKLGQDLVDIGDSSLDTWSLVLGRFVLDKELFKSLDTSFVVSDLNVVSVDDDRLLDSQRSDILESFDVSLSAASDLSVETGSGESHLSNMLESSEVNSESSFAALDLCALEANLDSLVRLLEPSFTSSDTSGESGSSSDSTSFLSS